MKSNYHLLSYKSCATATSSGFHLFAFVYMTKAGGYKCFLLREYCQIPLVLYIALLLLLQVQCKVG